MGRKAKQEPIYYDRKFNMDIRKRILLKRQQLGLNCKPSSTSTPQTKQQPPTKKNGKN